MDFLKVIPFFLKVERRHVIDIRIGGPAGEQISVRIMNTSTFLNHIPKYLTSNSNNNLFNKAPEDEEETAKEVSSTIRIRNLEDLFKQIQEHTVRHSPSGSEENRMSETEVDRHYRHDAHPG